MFRIFIQASIKLKHYKNKYIKVLLCHTLVHGECDVWHVTNVYCIFYCFVFIHVVFKNIEFYVLL